LVLIREFIYQVNENGNPDLFQRREA